ncbi:hypothetical protein FGO68_gene17141 [Halteria grandinella]|uniref:Uncharacterized protein n=1 Tax=Halteria grandinella TaxID=5974 RepID=A0A8J8NAU8_HALGN|nr:hypothetical protein FGO68_gene17141 [Halteria grandinella]
MMMQADQKDFLGIYKYYLHYISYFYYLEQFLITQFKEVICPKQPQNFLKFYTIAELKIHWLGCIKKLSSRAGLWFFISCPKHLSSLAGVQTGKRKMKAFMRINIYRYYRIKVPLSICRRGHQMRKISWNLEHLLEFLRFILQKPRRTTEVELFQRSTYPIRLKLPGKTSLKQVSMSMQRFWKGMRCRLQRIWMWNGILFFLMDGRTWYMRYSS